MFKRFYASKAWTYAEATRWQQSFNQISTKVDLRLSLVKANWLPEYAKENLRKTSQLRKSKSDELIITSDKTRSQAKNIQDCYEKLVNVIKESVAVAKEPDQATLARVEKLRAMEDKHRKGFKKKHSQKKNERRSKGNDY
ncbi:hypothetical protein INT48_009444 [Thamnidium elegans]|uniref:Prokaryotic-type class I peptide chain release factors domain-containing protein n=1 Tax=Thamnidium elegans TaxID=101142 RepID=A0A8H7SSH5_9FUNG|nr:hypothetical protein INT48_009444 [Thamnidium elegans]